MMPRSFPLMLSLLLPWLSGCQNLQPSMAAEKTAAELSKQQQLPVSLQVPAAVSADLLANSRPLLPVAPLLPRFNVSAVNVELNEFFASLVADSEFSYLYI